MDIFAQAAINRVRFPELGQGSISIEEVFQIRSSEGREALIQVAQDFDAQIEKAGGSNKYRRGNTTVNPLLILKRDLLAYVIQYNYDQEDANRNAALESQEERELLELIHQKRQEEKKGKTLAELEAEYNAKYAGK